MMLFYPRLALQHISSMISFPELPAQAGQMAVVAAGLSLAANVIPELAWSAAGIGLIALLLLMTADLLTSYLTVPKAARRLFVFERAIIGKVLLLVIVGVCLILDVVIYVTASFLPHELGFLETGYLYTTLTGLLWLILVEIGRITSSISEREGSMAVPPTLIWMTQLIAQALKTKHRIDRDRWEKGGHDGEPPNRWEDVDPEEAAAIIMERAAAEGEEVEAPLKKKKGKP